MKDPERGFKFVLFLVGVFLTPITLAGALFGFWKAYTEYYKPFGKRPHLTPEPIIIFSMVMYAVLIWVFLIAVFWFYFKMMNFVVDNPYNSQDRIFFTVYAIVSSFLSVIMISVMTRWRFAELKKSVEAARHGSARWAEFNELKKYIQDEGVYLGVGHAFNDQGHFLLCAGSRGGKGTSIIIPNLLGITKYDGSWVVIDPKGENLRITERYQREAGRKVIKLSPWGTDGNHYNPLDILDENDPDMCDDAMMIAEMIVPLQLEKKGDEFFTDKARALIAGLIMHVVRTEKNPNLSTVWKWLRQDVKGLDALLTRMQESHDEIIQFSANEIVSIKEGSGETFSSIMATAQQFTDFLKSPSLRENLTYSDFKTTDLTDGNTTLYIVIPSDKLKSHYQWTRLVSVTLLRSCSRHHKNKVTFILDEFAALGYISEIEVALSTYAGYNISIMPVVQSLIQLKAMYHDNWETFMGNSAIKHFFTIRDNFTAEYVSKLFGRRSVMTTETDENGKESERSTQRALITPDELMTGGANNMYVKIEDLNPTIIAKFPYYVIPEIQDRADK